MEFRQESIRELRNSRNMTIELFSQQIGASKQVVSTWETGACEPRIGSLVKIANAFQVPLEFFFCNTVTTVVNNAA